MNATVVAKSYWRSIKRGTRTFASVPAALQDAVKELAVADVAAGEITAGEYQTYIGEEYVAPEDTQEPTQE